MPRKIPEPGPICGAKTRGGTPCQSPPLKGKVRCKLHGGLTPMGVDQGAKFRTGMYSRALPAPWRKVYDQIVSDPTILECRDEIAILQTRLVMLMQRVGTGFSTANVRKAAGLLKNARAAHANEDHDRVGALLDELDQLVTDGAADDGVWRDVTEHVDLTTKVAEREWKRIVANRAFATYDQLRAVFASVVDAVLTHVTDVSARAAIAERFDRLRILEPLELDGPAPGGGEPAAAGDTGLFVSSGGAPEAAAGGDEPGHDSGTSEPLGVRETGVEDRPPG